MKATELASDTTHSVSEVSRDFVNFVSDLLKLPSVPEIELDNSLELSDEFQTFGLFRNTSDSIKIQTAGRHLLDILRTLAHELVHYDQKLQGDLDSTDLQELEDSANAVAGRILRVYYKKHPEFFSATADKLTEAVDADSDSIPWQQIGTECSDVLEAIAATGKFLYRGTKTRKEISWYQSQSHSDRTPVDTSPVTQKYLDYYFELAGIRARRGNSIYTTTDFRNASGYGSVYMIFPRNGFAWSGSVLIRDLYVSDPFFVSDVSKPLIPNNWSDADLVDDLRTAFYADDTPEEVKTVIADAWLKIKDNPATKTTVNHRTIALADVFERYQSATPLIKQLHQRYNQKNLATPEVLVKKLGYGQSAITDVMNVGFEILISGTYYAVHSRYQQAAEIKLLTP